MLLSFTWLLSWSDTQVSGEFRIVNKTPLIRVYAETFVGLPLLGMVFLDPCQACYTP